MSIKQVIFLRIMTHNVDLRRSCDLRNWIVVVVQFDI